MKVSDELFELLATLRTESGLSYAEMGRLSGMSHSSFSRLFHRVTKDIDAGMVDALCVIFKVEAAQLLAASLGNLPPAPSPMMMRESGARYGVDPAADMARRFAALEPPDQAFVLEALERAEKA